MHIDYKRADDWSHKIIGAATEVHREKGHVYWIYLSSSNYR